MSTVDTIISADTPFGIPSNPKVSKKTPFKVYGSSNKNHDVLLYHIENSKRKIEYVSIDDLKKNTQDISKSKVFITGASGSGDDPKVMGDPIFAPKHSVCSQSYLYAAFDSDVEAKNFIRYIRTRFFRALVAAVKITQSGPNKVYRFVPLESFNLQSDIDWNLSISEIEKQLYTKYALSEEEIQFIESRIEPMD